MPKTKKGALGAMAKASGSFTTLMIRNIPRDYSQNDFLTEVVENLGFANSVDFAYLPWDMNGSANIGYAFVNFTAPATAQAAVKALAKHQFMNANGRSGKLALVGRARIQGLEDNLRHLMSQLDLHSGREWPSEPLVFWKGAALKVDEVFAKLRANPTDSDGLQFAEIMDKVAGIPAAVSLPGKQDTWTYRNGAELDCAEVKRSFFDSIQTSPGLAARMDSDEDSDRSTCVPSSRSPSAISLVFARDSFAHQPVTPAFSSFAHQTYTKSMVVADTDENGIINTVLHTGSENGFQVFLDSCAGHEFAVRLKL